MGGRVEGLGKLWPGKELQLLGERVQDQPLRILVLGTMRRPGCPWGHNHSSVDWASRAGLDLHSGDSRQYLAETPGDLESEWWNLEARDGLDCKGDITCCLQNVTG